MLSRIAKMGSEGVQKRARKVLMYGMIVLIVVLSVTATLNFLRGWYLQSKVDQLEAQMKLAVEANETLSDSVDSIRRLRELDSQVLDRMTKRLSDQLEKDSQLKTQLEILEATNESARDYLDTPIHRDISRLLENGSDGKGSTNAAEKPSDDVRTGASKATDVKP